MQKVIKALANTVPPHHTLVYTLQLLGLLLIIPVLGVMRSPTTSVWLPHDFIQTSLWIILLAMIALILLIMAKIADRYAWVEKLKGEVQRIIILGGMRFAELDLFNNFVIFGTIGSGKTVSAVYPLLEQITKVYNQEDARSPRAKWGGMAVDAKGNFHESLIYTMAKEGRDILKDLVIIRPDNDYYMVEFEDLETGNHYFVAATGGTKMQECNLVLNTATGPVLTVDESGIKYLVLPTGRKESLNSFLFSDRKRFTDPGVHAALKTLVFDIKGLSVRWLGWREERGRLVRVLRTVNKQVEYKYSEAGDKIYCNIPNRLKYVTAHFLNNGLTYNLIAANVASTEAAARISAVAELMGNSMGGDNAYWKMAAHKHMSNCIELKRQVDGDTGTECSVNDIQIFTTNESTLNSYVVKLGAVVKLKEQQGITVGELQTLRNLENYFTGEWRTLDQKTKSNIISCVTNLFGDIPGNPQLIKTFCQPSRLSFESCMNEGKVYVLVLNAFPSARKLVGTCMKLDFQQTVLKRMTAAPLNADRFLMYLADENQFFFTTAGSGGDGDEDFMSIAREARICNILVTQSVSSYLAVVDKENKINAMLQCAGNRIFFMNADDKTNKFAEATAGQILVDKLTRSGADLKLSSPFGDSKSGSVSSTPEKVNRYDHGHFGQMRKFEAVIFNISKETGPKTTKANLKRGLKFWDKKAVIAVVNQYYQAFMENRAFDLGLDYIFDSQENFHLDNVKECAHRNSGLLRSWANGLPVLPRLGGTDVATDSNFEVEQANLAAEEPSNDVLSATPLEALPPFESLRIYNRENFGYSDLENSQASDPLFSRKDDKVTTTGNALKPAPAEQNKDPLPLPTNRILAHMVGINRTNDDPKN